MRYIADMIEACTDPAVEEWVLDDIFDAGLEIYNKVPGHPAC